MIAVPAATPKPPDAAPGCYTRRECENALLAAHATGAPMTVVDAWLDELSVVLADAANARPQDASA